MVQLIDNYAATYSVLIIGLCECLALSYVYGERDIIAIVHVTVYINILYYIIYILVDTDTYYCLNIIYFTNLFCAEQMQMLILLLTECFEKCI